MFSGDLETAMVPAVASKTYVSNTAQPSQAIGRPQPIPYFFAGNQTFFFISFTSFSGRTLLIPCQPPEWQKKIKGTLLVK